MPQTAPHTQIDPIRALIDSAGRDAGRFPIPLVATRYAVEIDGGLAVVSAIRTYQNNERDSIEATLTFPMPVQAVLFSLEARIGERLLLAKARRKSAAREHYEEAMDNGKTALLHEELMPGIHMLSLGHIAPGTSIDVTARWSMPLSLRDGTAHLRIPLTVGDVYGTSGLLDCEEMTHEGPTGMAELIVGSASGTVSLLGADLQDGQALVPLDAPIDLKVTGSKPRELHGISADHRRVVLQIDPAMPGDAKLDVALLIDHSGSMQEACGPSARSKHQVITDAIANLGSALRTSDTVSLWEFDNALNFVGATGTAPLSALAKRLSAPAGGTEIGAALTGLLARSNSPDILLITDGKSHALNVQALARSGRRISVILVGEDSLEARIGHLALLTGGDIHVASGDGLASLFATALGALRIERNAQAQSADRSSRIEITRGGMHVIAEWKDPSGEEPNLKARAVAAYAAWLALPGLDEAEAAKLAEAEGLVTHLTSLVLIDEEAERLDGVPASRKIALPTPRTSAWASVDIAPAGRRGAAAMCQMLQCNQSPGGNLSSEEDLSFKALALARKPRTTMWGEIAWDSAARKLQRGDLRDLSTALAAAIRAAAVIPEIMVTAAEIGLKPHIFVIGLLAWRSREENRTAARVAKKLLKNVPASRCETLLALIDRSI